MNQSNIANVERAGTVELNASVDGVEMYAYMAPGCCGARCFYGLNKATPAQVIEGIVISGISGCIMFLTDAYSGGKQAHAFAEFVNTTKLSDGTALGSAVVSDGIPNLYTSKTIYGVIFCYNPRTLQKWLQEKNAAEGKPSWTRPENWFSTTDAVHMDSVFYQFGGRPRPKSSVRIPDWMKGESESKQAE